MKRNYHYILSGILFAAMSAGTQAQTQHKDTTMNRTVVVEQEYAPDIMDAPKINVLPQVEEPTVSKKTTEYATTASPTTSIPTSLMRPYSQMETQPGNRPGYIRAGYGNYGNLDLFANYLFHLSNKDKLNLHFQMDGMSGKLNMPLEDEKWKAYYYRTRADMDYTHQFKKMDLNIAGNFGLSNFNFAPKEFGKQKFTSGEIHIGAASTDETLPLQFRAETNLMLYDRQNNIIGKEENLNFKDNNIHETQIRTKAFVSGAISDEQTINIQLQLSNLFYNKEISGYNGRPVFDSHTALGFNPYYESNGDSWKLHLGANSDFSFGGGKTLRISPDITAQYVFSDSYVVYAKATGGKIINDFRKLEEICPYINQTSGITDTYEQINAAIGFKTSPAPGLWFNLYGGYQDLKDDLYQVRNNYVIPNSDPENPESYRILELNSTNTHNVYAGLKTDYTYKDLFAISAEGVFYHWTAKAEAIPNVSNPLYLKPKFTLNFESEIHPIPALRINFGYRHIGWSASELSNNINNLHIGGSYNFFKGVSAYARINNLLNKKYQYFLGYPSEGLNFLGGLSFQF